MYFAISVDPRNIFDRGVACFFDTLERAMQFKNTWESAGLIVRVFRGNEIVTETK